jgi:energy-coupling factor transporter ATP-binding protein EcfA2
MLRIKRLDVQGYRGIRQPVSLLFDGKSILLFGENGTGKSSFVDALERLFLGQVSTLDGRAGLSSDRHGPHIRGASEFPPHISLVFDDRNSSTVNLGDDHSSFPVEIQEYLRCAMDNVYILRRRQLLDFVESQPRERYQLLRSFLPIDAVDAWESAIKAAQEELTQDTRVAARAESATLDRVKRVLAPTSLTAPSEPDVVKAINDELVRVGLAAVARMGEVSQAIGGLDETISHGANLASYLPLSAARDDLTEVIRTVDLVDVVALQTALQALHEIEHDQAHIFSEGVLRDGARWIQQAGLRVCPLCEQPIDSDAVVRRAEARLTEMAELVRRRAAVSANSERLRDLIVRANGAATRARRSAEKLAAPIGPTLAAVIDSISGSLDGLQRRVTSAQQQPTTEITEAAAALRPDGTILRGAESVLSALDREMSNVASGAGDVKMILAARSRIAELSEAWEQYGLSRQRSAAAVASEELTKHVREAAEAARKEELQILFDDLSTEINELYTRLHQDEPLGQVRLEMREAVHKSLNIKADFYERSAEDPRAFYSEAHLDTLGIAIFLALRRWHYRQDPSCNLIVLDDVMTSVDSPHAVRMAEVLLSDFSGFQMLITTHDRIWYEHLRDIQARCGVAQAFVNKVIHKWTIDEGPDLREPEDERRLIDHYTREGSGHEIAITAGRLLEHVLQELRYGLRLSIEAKRGEVYEIGELWPAFYREMKRNYPTFYSEARKTLDALNVRWPLRNWVGAHRNNWAQNVSRSTAIEFANAVGDLFDRVFCSRCRRFITPSTAPLGQLSCRCGQLIYAASGKEARQPADREELVRTTKGSLSEAALDTSRYFELKQAERQDEK